MNTITPARLQWTAAGEPFATDFGDCYFSALDGYAETQHVFIDGNRLRERWSAPDQKHFVIGETGLAPGSTL